MKNIFSFFLIADLTSNSFRATAILIDGCQLENYIPRRFKLFQEFIENIPFFMKTRKKKLRSLYKLKNDIFFNNTNEKMLKMRIHLY